MAKKWEVSCIVCGKRNSFGDEKDITFSKWKIVAWNVNTSEPKCVCDKCEYKGSVVKDK